MIAKCLISCYNVYTTLSGLNTAVFNGSTYKPEVLKLSGLVGLIFKFTEKLCVFNDPLGKHIF